MFWVTFAEMARVVKAGGFVYISVPVNGPVHRHPMDCWRFYPDAYFGPSRLGAISAAAAVRDRDVSGAAARRCVDRFCGSFRQSAGP